MKFSELPLDTDPGSAYFPAIKYVEGTPENVRIPFAAMKEAPTLLLELTSDSAISSGVPEFADWAVQTRMLSNDADWVESPSPGIRFYSTGFYVVSIVAKLAARAYGGNPAYWPDGSVVMGTELDVNPSYIATVPALSPRSAHAKYGQGGGYLDGYGYETTEQWTDQYVLRVNNVNAQPMGITVHNLWHFFNPSTQFDGALAVSVRRIGDLPDES
jgi:hypothetical protein